MISLRRRLNRGLIIILSIVFVAHWLAADWVIRSVAEKQMLTRLQHDGDSLLDTLKLNAEGQLIFDSSHAGTVYGQAFSGHYFVLQVAGKAYYSKSLQDVVLPFTAEPVNTARQFHFPDGPQHQPLLALSRGFERFGHAITISVAEDLSDIGHDIDHIRLAYLVLTTMVLLIAIALQSNDVRRSLKPLRAARDELAEIAYGRQSQIQARVPAEIKPLVKEVNRLLVLVERRLHQSRTAIGNLAHALKTPLAMLFRLAENPQLDDYPDLRNQLQQQTQAIHERIERELKRARISGNMQTASVFNPRQELTALVMLLKNIYAEKNLMIQVNAPDQLINFDREDMLELTGNLLDNACKWGHKQVVVTVKNSHGMTISVEDDGPACSAQDMQQLSKRGLRLDEAVQGHGLGLAIVRDIAVFYGGTLQISRSEQLGGLQVTVQFPR
ncbi:MULTISPECIES: sensor histidine kinase [Methylomonas]|uniref:histidine kinase n=2 Tax=Methylomonas TaxID=416 RepID=A0A140E6L0_9GAMM|nr:MULTISPECIES: sensor histidine kinase [Methylomonas]AMK79034.1 histidine kinase [Methylomonas denitrificans]OAI00197.1 histidine kinase [Methylomonas methanica]TCV79173.1 signal transduction histidine kinase [Methylomonas methanica]